MLVDVSQLHENHLYKLDTMVKHTGETLSEFIKFSAAAAYSFLDNMMSSFHNVIDTIEKGLEQAQNQKLSFTLFPTMFYLQLNRKLIKLRLITALFLMFQK